MGEVLQIVDPWTGDVALRLPLDGPERVASVVEAARERRAGWAATPLAERVALVERWVEVALAEGEEVALAVSTQMGKPIGEARGEIGRMVERARMMMGLAPDALGDRSVALGDGIHRSVVRDPLGVVLVIAAWNYPLLIAVNAVVPALLAGNTVILKHASQTAGIGRWFESSFQKAGAPAGLVSAVTVRGRDMASLVQHRDVGGVFFTGSTEAGRDVYARVGAREHGFIDAGLELGGKDPAYVRPDMPLDVVVPNLVEGAFYNAGQSCCAVERIYVHEDQYDAFVEAYLAEARAWTVADPRAPGTRIGALAAASTRDVIESQVAEAVAKGGRLLLGGTRLGGPGWRFPATVVADADQGSSLMQEESFGPVIGLRSVRSDAEAVAMMNDTVFGLTASIWTADHAVGRDLARQVAAGTVFVNRCDYVDPALPWTGLGDSGKGITLSGLGFHHMTRARGLHVRPLSLMR